MFAALGSIGSDAVAIARAAGGTAYVADADQRDLAFASLVLADDADALAPVADIGLYRVELRRMRHQRRFWPDGEPSPGVTAIYGMVHHPDLTHEAADAHWRDVHAPLALRHHPGMWHYHQVSIVEVMQGIALDGLALCAFASGQEMRERFFGDDHDRDVISADVARFADGARSLRRVRATEWRFGPD